MIIRLITKLLVGIIGTWIAVTFIPGITVNGDISTIIYVGVVLGLLLFFLKPILSAITLPLRIVTLNLFTIVIIMGLIWIVDIFVPIGQFEVVGIYNLLLYALIVWILEFITSIVKK